MKKVQVVTLALLALFAFSAVLASSASAEVTLLAEWLVGGSPIVGKTLATETTGSILLEDSGVPAATICSGILDGTVGPNGTDEITMVLNLKSEEVKLGGLALSSAKGDCTNESGCNIPIEVFPENLPWKTQLFLMENGKILDLIVSSGYAVKCTELGIKIEDTCTIADTELEVLNDPVTGDAETPANAIAEPLANCSIGGNGKGINETVELATIALVNGELLTVSSE